MRRMGEAGMEIPRALGQAEMQMRDARGALQQGQPGRRRERAVAGGRRDAARRPGDDGADAGADGAPAGRRARAASRSRTAGEAAIPWAAPRATTAAWTPAGCRCPRRATSGGRATCSRNSIAASGDRNRPSARARLLPAAAGPVLSPCAWSSAAVAELRRAARGRRDRHAGAALYRHGQRRRRRSSAYAIPRPRSAPTT